MKKDQWLIIDKEYSDDLMLVVRATSFSPGRKQTHWEPAEPPMMEDIEVCVQLRSGHEIDITEHVADDYLEEIRENMLMRHIDKLTDEKEYAAECRYEARQEAHKLRN